MPILVRFTRPTLVLAVAALLLVAGAARAFHDEPRRAKTIKAPLVTSYMPCTSPNTATTGTPGLPSVLSRRAQRPALRVQLG